MRSQTINILMTLLILAVFSGRGQANDPAEDTPWPIGFNAGEMNISRTLMNSYGDLNGSWLCSVFHAGIDIDATTGYPNCDEVRCVDGGYATLVQEIPIPGTDGLTQWLVIICDELGGTVQNGWSYGHLDQPPFPQEALVADNALVGTMTTNIDTPHVHFMWTDWNSNDFSYCNPLNYLDPAPIFEENYQWVFNPENNSPSFDYFFLEDMNYSAWENLTVVETENLMLDQSCLSGNVDFFFGVSLHGEGMPFGGGVGRNDLTSQKIKYDVVRELVSGEETLDTRYVFDFDCVLKADTANPDDSRAQMLYFRHSMQALFGHDALAYCLTNSNSSEEWDGISTISENCWNTDCFEIDETNSTVNPVLAMYPDGPYHLDVLCYSFDEDYTFPESVDGVELHNFYPALKEVLVIDSFTDGTYYRAIWEPDASGLLAELNIVSDQPIPAGTELEVILIFTEEMNTETGSVSASLGTSSISNGNWTSSTVSNDTWTGEVTMPSEVTDQTYVLSVSASDTNNNDLMDPEGTGSVPGPVSDTHHTVTLGFPSISHQWTATIHSYILGSPKLADIDGDGDLDVIIQSEDGYVDVLDDDGSSVWGGGVDGLWPVDAPDVYASPAIADLSGSSLPEVIAVHPYGCNGFTSTGQAIQVWGGIQSSSELRWFSTSSPASSNVIADDFNEFVMGRVRVQGGSGIGIFSARESDGTPLWGGGLGSSGSIESVSATSCIANLDNIGNLEVIVATSAQQHPNRSGTDEEGRVYCFDAEDGDPIWEYNSGSPTIMSAVVAGNLDNDDQLEVVVGLATGSGGVRVIDGATGLIENWGTLPTGSFVYAGASIADINADGDNNLVVSCADGLLYCWGWNGSSFEDLPGFPINLGTWTDDGVSIGDVDSDGMLEMVIAGKDGKLHVINHDGMEVGGFPVSVSTTNPLSGQPALGDIDNDGKLEIIFGEVSNSVIYCYEMGENSAYNDLPW
ncbi:MAG: VCBS repeat-containing protein, partial [Candidatus Fermentibacteraceae bacterium]|nr:VCBS repeat-containing protein [Candidatus Fermentibacteraceae bacterium]